jgi:hypothetical protein
MHRERREVRNEEARLATSSISTKLAVDASGSGTPIRSVTPDFEERMRRYLAYRAGKACPYGHAYTRRIPTGGRIARRNRKRYRICSREQQARHRMWHALGTIVGKAVTPWPG